MLLNESLDFRSVGNDVQQAFLGRRAERRLLEVGHELYKFTQYPLANGDRITPWWSSVLPLTAEDTGLQKLIERSDVLGVNPAEFARARNAVTQQWNSMTGLLIARLKMPVYGFVGRVSHQAFDLTKGYENVVYIGGAVQVWIPGLTLQHINRV